LIIEVKWQPYVSKEFPDQVYVHTFHVRIAGLTQLYGLTNVAYLDSL